jgi:hypothetical protein
VSRLADNGGWRGWAGLVAAPLAWALHHQVGGDLNFAGCARGGGQGTLVAIGLIALAVAAAATALSLGAWRRAPEPDEDGRTPLRRFVPALGVMAGGLFGLTILVQILAALILPPCFR